MRRSLPGRAVRAVAALGLLCSGAAFGQAMSPAQLASEMAAAADELRRELPMRVDDMTTLTGLRAEGTQFVYEMAVSRDLPDSEIENARQLIQTQNQTNLCRDSNTRFLIDAGGSMRHIYTDPDGDRFETLVGACADDPPS